MAFENICNAPHERRLVRLSGVLAGRKIVPSKFMVVGLDHTMSSINHKSFALFYDREAHEAAYESLLPENRHTIPRPPYGDSLRAFIDGFMAAR